jgi:hypothetical protein
MQPIKSPVAEVIRIDFSFIACVFLISLAKIELNSSVEEKVFANGLLQHVRCMI